MAQLTLTTPTTRTAINQYVVVDFHVLRSGPYANIIAELQDSTGVAINQQSFSVPDLSFPTATVVGFLTAIGGPRAGESGTVANRANYRILGFLADNGYITGVTLGV